MLISLALILSNQYDCKQQVQIQLQEYIQGSEHVPASNPYNQGKGQWIHIKAASRVQTQVKTAHVNIINIYSFKRQQRMARHKTWGHWTTARPNGQHDQEI